MTGPVLIERQTALHFRWRTEAQLLLVLEALEWVVESVGHRAACPSPIGVCTCGYVLLMERLTQMRGKEPEP